MGLFRKAIYAGFATYFLFSYNPEWTRRKFQEKIPLEPLTMHAPSRTECLRMLAQSSQPDKPLDVLVVGGGASGAGVALDASMRGLHVGLIEMNDYCSGTSSKSTKLIHGGIRYLEKAIMQLSSQQLNLVIEALRERTIMLHQAPHLCHPLRTLIPCYNMTDFWQYVAGVAVYDVLAASVRGTIEFSTFFEHRELFKLFPKIKLQSKHREVVTGAATYFDGQMDDARMGLAVVLTAACYGAAVANYCKLVRVEQMDNGLIKATVRDQRGGAEMTITTKSIVNCAGPFSDQVRSLVAPPDAQPNIMRPSSGTHVTLPAKYCPAAGNALIIPSTDGRVIFSCPFQGKCIAGTTDNPCTVSENPAPTKQEVSFILKNLSEFLSEPVPEKDVLSCWNGIRPLAVDDRHSNSSKTENIVREHIISRDKYLPNVLHMTGGKWTTYRKMAEECVDNLLVNVLTNATVEGSMTSETLLIGAHDLAKISQQARNSAVPDVTHDYWLSAYGDRLPEVENLALHTPGGMKLLHPEFPVVAADVIYAARHEQCETVEDFLSRRCRMSFLNATAALAAVPTVASILAKEKSWSSARQKHEETAARATITAQFFAS